MLLHIGENRFVPLEDVIAIRPAQQATAETDQRLFTGKSLLSTADRTEGTAETAGIS